MKQLYGYKPVDLGVVGENIDCDEMMFYMYYPIKKAKDDQVYVEHRLAKYLPLLEMVKEHCGDIMWKRSNVYITAKTIYVNKNSMGQRMGWHSDGFMTHDLNFIWYTDVPTEFMVLSNPVALTQDHEKSMWEMNGLALSKPEIYKYNNRHLLCMDEGVIHRTCPDSDFEGVRTFVKISVSDKEYNLKGNSINPLIPITGGYVERGAKRNCPQGNS